MWGVSLENIEGERLKTQYIGENGPFFARLFMLG